MLFPWSDNVLLSRAKASLFIFRYKKSILSVINEMGDTVRVARVVGETLILEKVPSRGTDSEL